MALSLDGRGGDPAAVRLLWQQVTGLHSADERLATAKDKGPALREARPFWFALNSWIVEGNS